MKIVLVEDDHLQSELLIPPIESRFENAEVTLIETELDFRNALPNLKLDPPDVILLDIMLRWTNPTPNLQPAPPDVQQEGFYNAGFRCQQLLSETEQLRHVPVILYSVLDKVDLEEKLKGLPPTVTHLPKDNDLSFLFAQIKRIASRVKK